MKFEKEILEVLSRVGADGLSVQKISIHVLNACNSLFETVDYNEVHSQVSKFLLYNSKKRSALVERVGKRGVYRLNRKSAEVRQLLLNFGASNDEQSQEEKPACEDLSLDLFGEF